MKNLPVGKPDIDSMPASALVRLPQVLELVPVSRATLHRYIASGRFPAPVKLSTRVAAWHVGDLRHWLTAQEAA